MSASLAHHLFTTANEIQSDYVRELVEEGVKKADFITFVIEFVGKYSLTNNVWLLSQLKAYFTAIESTKQSDKPMLIKYYFEVLNLLVFVSKQRYVFCSETDKKTISNADINSVVLDVNYSVVEDELSSMNSIVKNDVYKLLIVLYSCITKSNNLPQEENIRKCFLILRYLLTLPPKSYLKTKENKIDVIDLIFIVLITFSHSTYCSRLVKEYIHLSKDIFYYRATKQRKMQRINFIFYTVYVIVFNDVVSTEFEKIMYIEDNSKATCSDDDQETNDNDEYEQDCDGKENNGIIQPYDKCKFLFFYSEYDEPLALQVKFEKERNKLKNTYRPSYKEIDVAWTINNEKDFIFVLKEGKC